MATATLETMCTGAREDGRWGVVFWVSSFNGYVERNVTQSVLVKSEISTVPVLRVY